MSKPESPSTRHSPLDKLDDWDDFVKQRYAPNPGHSAPSPSASPTAPAKSATEFRDYEADARPTVREFYRLNHRHQTYAFGQAKRQEFLSLGRRRMGIWEAAEYLNTLVDDSDPDTDLSQLEHLLQTSEHIRSQGQPPWFILAGFVHDLGKVLCLWGEPQWAVVGDTFPTGCRFSDAVVFPQYFAENPDSQNSTYASELGVYERGCGLDRVQMSWGHDEYIFQVTRNYLPREAQYMLRYHSFYPWHREGAYDYLTSPLDREMLPWVQRFNSYDLYTKSHAPPDVAALRPYYQRLIAEYFPAEIAW